MVGKFRGSKSGLASRGGGAGRRESRRPSSPRQKEKEPREEEVGLLGFPSGTERKRERDICHARRRRGEQPCQRKGRRAEGREA